MLVNKSLFSGLEPSGHGSACPYSQTLHLPNQRLHPNSLQGPRLLPARALAGHSRGCPDLAHARDPPDDLVADHELVLGPQFWFCFALGFRLKPQVLQERLLWFERR